MENAIRTYWPFAASAVVVYGPQRLVPTHDMEWYKVLQKPSWQPPSWVFPTVWIPLKVLQTVALGVLWMSREGDVTWENGVPMGLVLAHSVLGAIWNLKFFAQRKLKGSLPVMGSLWLATLGAVATAWPISRLAALLLAPTQLWLTIAAKLNWDIVKLNKNKMYD